MQRYDQELTAAAARIRTLQQVCEQQRLAELTRGDAAAGRRNVGQAALAGLGRWLVETGQHLQTQYGAHEDGLTGSPVHGSS